MAVFMLKNHCRNQRLYPRGMDEIAKTFYLVEYYQIASEPLSGLAADKILPYRTGAWDTRTALSSMRRDKDNRLLLGTVGGKDETKSFLSVLGM